MEFQRRSNGQVIDLSHAAPFGKGGEADIYLLPNSAGLAVKIYHNWSEERAAKLALMQQYPPDDPSLALGHTSIAWPTDLLHTPGKPKEIKGFIMPRIQGLRPVSDFYNPVKRCQHCPLFSYRYLLQAARNITMTVAALHRRHYIIGDINDKNILVGSNALISFVDTDSFQVKDPKSARIFRCSVGTPDFTPPELQGRNFDYRDRVVAHDHFGLAVLLFEMLMEGIHPFEGVYQGKGGSPSRADRIATGSFPYGRYPVPYSIRIDSPNFAMLHPDLQSLFTRAFEDGDSNALARPIPGEWQAALETASNNLSTCAENSQHFYSPHLGACPWCERKTQLRGIDPFPSIESVRAGEHLQVPNVIQMSLPPAHQEYARFSSPVNGGYNYAPLPFSNDDGEMEDVKPRHWVRNSLVGIGTLLAGAAIAWFVVNHRPTEALHKASVNQKVQAPINSLNLGETAINPADEEEMAWVPSGEFRMGSSEEELKQLFEKYPGLKVEAMEPERPQHKVTLNGYYIYKNLVSVKRYLRFCHMTGRPLPQAPENNTDWRKQTLPIENVSWEDAMAYCKWVGGSLPTEAQWEKAARGVSGRQYPWGDFWDETKCRKSKFQYADSGGAFEIGGFRNAASPCGAYDMAGNVWEWCRDWYGEDYYQRSPVREPAGPESGNNHVLRGGSWCDTEPYRFRSAFRFNSYNTNLRVPKGFRCVVIPKASTSYAVSQGVQ